MSDDFSPDRLADRARIVDLLHRWCRAVDRLDADGMKAVFHPDATDDHGHFRGTVDDLVSWITNRHQAIPFSLHSISNVIIDFTGADRAIVESVVMTCQHYPIASEATVALFNTGTVGRPLNLTAFARYADVIERRGGEWRIAKRTVIHDSQIASEAPERAQFEGIETGQRNRSDFIYRLLAQHQRGV